MKIGLCGLGKLGLPVALAIESRGHDVRGCDLDPTVAEILANRRLPYREQGAQALLETSRITLCEIDELVRWADVCFVTVQTPHQPRFEGVTPLPLDRADFDYSYLVWAITDVARAARKRSDPLTLAVVSTVLPGTTERLLRPLLNEQVRLVYNPSFIAMGTTVDDYLDPEFVLLGVDDETAAEQLEAFYATVTDAPVRRMSVASAELAKVAYNVAITAKVTIANLLAQVADATGANVDDVTGAMQAAHRRIVSPAYMTAGMGDGGGCHPRDNVALSWLARERGLPDLFTAMMSAREEHARWLAEIVTMAAVDVGLPVIVMGKAYKPGTNLTVGSPATLLVNLLPEPTEWWDPHVDETPAPSRVACYVVATDHPEFHAWSWPRGSTVVDPFGTVSAGDGVTLIRPGRR